MLRIAILDMNNGRSNEGMRCIRQIVQEFLDGVSGEMKEYEVRQRCELPEIDDFDILISSGGPGSPHYVGEEWEYRFRNLLDEIWYHNSSEILPKKHVFFICHSFQLAVLHWGLAEVTLRKSPSFGIMPVHKTHEGEHEPLFRKLDDPFYAVDFRDYQIIQPNLKKLESMGAKIVSIEKYRPHVKLERAVMSIRFSKEIFGTQYHPEADSIGMKHYFLKEEKKQQVISQHGEEKYQQMLELLDNPNAIAKTEKIIIPEFLRMAAEDILQVANI